MGVELRGANRKRHRIIIKRRLLSENLVLRQRVKRIESYKMQIRNYTKYTGAEQWLQETYPHLYPIWLHSISNTEEYQLNTLELTCSICRIKQSSGLHYGVKMCEADKQFLKRTFHYQIIYSPCAQGGDGVCPPRPRGWCQICRLRRCLSTPVMIGMIRVGNKTPRSRSSNSPTTPNEPMFTITVQQPPICEPLPLRTPHLALPKNYLDSDAIKGQSNYTQYKEDSAQFSFIQSSNLSVTQPLSFKEQLEYNSRLSEVQYQDYDGINHFDGLHPRIPFPNTSSTQYLQNGHQIPSAFSSVISDDQPLDLSLKTTTRKKNEAEWYEQEPLEASSVFPTGIVYVDYEEPLDLSPLSNHADPYEASDYSLSSSRDPSRSSSRDSGTFPNLRTPSPTLDGSQGLGINRLSASINKLSVNSTLLGDALSRIQANISMSSSLVNLSSVSDILSESKVSF